MKRHDIFWSESERLAMREHCGCKARGKRIKRAIGDGVVLAMLVAALVFSFLIETVP